MVKWVWGKGDQRQERIWEKSNRKVIPCEEEIFFIVLLSVDSATFQWETCLTCFIKLRVKAVLFFSQTSTPAGLNNSISLSLGLPVACGACSA